MLYQLFIYNLVQNREAVRIIPKSFYVASIILISKRGKDITGKENFRLVSTINIDVKILNNILENRIKLCRKLYTMPKWNLFQTYKASSTFENQSI